MAQLHNINVVSLNVKGLRHPVKRTKSLDYFSSCKADICFLQETHVDDTILQYMKKKWVDTIVFSSAVGKKNGVAIFFAKKLHCQILHKISDKDGRYVLVKIKVNDSVLMLLNVYGPTADDPSFWSNLTTEVLKVGNTPLIVGGDFNVIFYPLLDRLSCTKFPPSKVYYAFKLFMQNTKLVDVWRLHFPTDKCFTFFSNPHNSHSRIDYFLVSRQLISSIISPNIGIIDISDHAMISLILNFDLTIPKQSRWRMNKDIVLNDTNKPKLLTAIQEFFQLNSEGSTSLITRWDAFKAYIRGVTIFIMAHEIKNVILLLKSYRNKLLTLNDCL